VSSTSIYLIFIIRSNINLINASILLVNLCYIPQYPSALGLTFLLSDPEDHEVIRSRAHELEGAHTPERLVEELLSVLAHPDFERVCLESST